jgi:hypothetical protein
MICDHLPKYRDGLCKPCLKKARDAVYYAANREKILRRHELNRDKLREDFRVYYQKNRRRLNAATRAWEKAHPEQVRQRELERYRRHPENKRTRTRIRRAAKKESTGHFTDREWQMLKRSLGSRCVGCWRREAELAVLGLILVPDHIVPLSKGGLNDITNIQPLCHGRNRGTRGGCNQTKGGRYLDFLVAY